MDFHSDFWLNLQDADEAELTYDCEKKPLKLRTENPGELDFLCELTKGRFSVTANVNHVSMFAKSTNLEWEFEYQEHQKLLLALSI